MCSWWTKSWLGTLISYSTMKWLWETKPVLYDYKLNQYFAFFILGVFSHKENYYQCIHFSNNMCFIVGSLYGSNNRTITLRFLSLNCTIWAFLPLKMPLCYLCCYVLYCCFKLWEMSPICPFCIHLPPSDSLPLSSSPLL